MTHPTHNWTKAATVALLTATLVSGLSQAESLFRAGITYQTQQSYTPRSLYAVPRANNVGDLVTIILNENSVTLFRNNTTVDKKQQLDETGTGVVNRVVRKFFGVRQLLPSVDGVKNEHQVNMRAQGQKQYKYTDSIAAQVVQVLPNGNLLVQGKKTIFANQEEQDLYVTGIVNPYYLDAKSQIASNLVGNLQLKVAGHGFVSRQQGDGILGKYYNLYNH